MLNETFYIDGVDARSVGIRLQSPMEFSDPVPICEIESIPGRNGDLIFETGAFENRTGSASCYTLDVCGRVDKAIRDANRFLLSKRGYRRLETSDDPDHYWMARVENGARIEQRLRKLSPFELSFDCKPQRFVNSGKNAIRITEPTHIYNPYGFPALPLFVIYGEGSGTVRISCDSGFVDMEILNLDSILFLDSETQNAYNYSGYQNNNINAPEFPALNAGENRISWDWTGNIQEVLITPRWWEL